MTTTAKPPGGFAVQPRRWVVERTFGGLVGCRRLRLEYGYLPETGEAMIQAAMIDLVIRRLHPVK